MSTPALTPTSYLVLGLVATLGRATSYDLKRRVATSVGYFWSFPHSQLYAEPARLAEAGLLDVEEEPSGRRRRVWSVTEAGLATLRAWLHDPAPERGEIRDPGLLKLFFGDLAEPADVAAVARAQAEAHRRRLAELDAIAARAGATADDASFPLRTLDLGRRVARLYVDFWDEVAGR
jgi:PadR family transcriptional regulator AphA